MDSDIFLVQEANLERPSNRQHTVCKCPCSKTIKTVENNGKWCWISAKQSKRYICRYIIYVWSVVSMQWARVDCHIYFQCKVQLEMTQQVAKHCFQNSIQWNDKVVKNSKRWFQISAVLLCSETTKAVKNSKEWFWINVVTTMQQNN